MQVYILFVINSPVTLPGLSMDVITFFGEPILSDDKPSFSKSNLLYLSYAFSQGFENVTLCYFFMNPDALEQL